MIIKHFNNLSRYIYLLFLVITMGCAIKTHLDDSELKWLNVYKENDTLIFKSDKGEYDTSIILKKEIFYPEYNPVEQQARYLPQWGVIWYKNKNLIYHPDGYILITIIKKSPNHNTLLSINYLYAGFVSLDILSDSLRVLKSNGVYHLNTETSRSRSSQPLQLFWDEKYGIVKYITINDVWERINLPSH